MGVIKAGHIRANQAVIFNLEDLHAQGNEYLSQVRREAANILAQARREAEQIKSAARNQGYEEGRRQAEKDAQQALAAEVAKRMESALPALNEAIAELRQARLVCLDYWNKTCLQLAVEIARRILRGELSRQPDVPLRWVEELLQLAAGTPSVEIHLSPGDCELLKAQVEKAALAVATVTKVSVIADPEIGPGGCRVITRYGTIDAGVDAQLTRLEEELL